MKTIVMFGTDSHWHQLSGRHMRDIRKQIQRILFTIGKRLGMPRKSILTAVLKKGSTTKKYRRIRLHLEYRVGKIFVEIVDPIRFILNNGKFRLDKTWLSFKKLVDKCAKILGKYYAIMFMETYLEKLTGAANN